ncbi:hypothetical protein Sden_1691 [Shewanella denitrificans OS217]|uniref:Hemopexin n=1 Tax=Shewanella denitrificans (strain OS217 / ATCC BAA-1090 / DSM 15013) TaxID=318161 RepID=Q12NK1_SHEDO|nr:hemopexin repeat-containing protein [Shewanella denitrificans]ABE54975.1 hypothetical protein Sden_1691 [Shewanella denitrificans OS217]
MRNDNLSDYQDIFGDLDFKQGDESRTVYSPAAYLADLLQLMEDEFKDGADLNSRRDDIRNRLLDEENTYTLVPYLSIVNEVLEGKLGSDVYTDKLLNAKYPFNAPFSLSEEELKLHLTYLGISSETLYKLFARELDEDTLVRESLGLSAQDWAVQLSDNSDDVVLAYYDEDASNIAPAKSALSQVSHFLKKTGLKAKQFKDLLFQNLSDAEISDGKQKHAHININSVSPGEYVLLDENEEWLKNSNPSSATPSGTWFGRVNRFIRLAEKTHFGFTELDTVLRHEQALNSSTQQQTAKASLRLLAIAKDLKQKLDITMQELMALMTSINQIGHGNEDLPQDLFNRVYNNHCVKQESRYIKGSGGPAHQFTNAQYQELSYSDDIFADENEDFRKRVIHSLKLPKNGLEAIIQKLKEKDQHESLWKSKAQKIDLLNFLYRFTRLASALDVSHNALFTLFDLLKQDYSLKAFNQHNSFIEITPSTQDSYDIFLKGTLEDRLWLLQSLTALNTWMQAHDFNAEQLWQIATGQLPDKQAQQQQNKQLMSQLDSLHQAFKPLRLSQKSFQKGEFDARAAGVIYRSLTQVRNVEGEHQLYLADAGSEQAAIEPNQTITLAELAIQSMSRVDKLDFTGLGIEQSLVDKIRRNLFYRGYVDKVGVIKGKHLPDDEQDFMLETDFSGYRTALFQLMHDLYQKAAAKTPAGEEVQFHLYPSDLSRLEVLGRQLPHNESQELYDNLVFNHYIDEEGAVKYNAFFSQAGNHQDFDTYTHINTLSQDVYQLLQHQLMEFEQADLYLTPSAFTALTFTEEDLAELMQNLHFNGYLDEHNRLVGKTLLLEQTAEDFKLALPFFPYQQTIHAILTDKALSHQDQYLAINSAELAKLADKAISFWAYEDLQHQYLDGQYLTTRAVDFFGEVSNQDKLVLGYYFEQQTSRAVFKRMQQIIKQAQAYQLTDIPLAEMKFYPEEIEQLVARLIDMGVLTRSRHIQTERLDYLLDANNVLSFSLDGFEDFNKEIFFLLQGIAKRTKTAISQIVSTETAVAEQQQQLLFNHLRGMFGLEQASMTAITRAMFSDQQAVMQAWMLPLFKAANALDKIDKIPSDPAFVTALRRIRQFALLADKLQLTGEEVDIAFYDQDLVAKFPENLVLPTSVTRIDAVLETPDFLYLFQGGEYWIYRYPDYVMVDGSAFADASEQQDVLKHQENDDDLREQLRLDPVRELFKAHDNLLVDAAFSDNIGNYYIVSGDYYYLLKPDADNWLKRENAFGHTGHEFDDLPAIDAAYTDEKGRLFLFSQGRYVRYSSTDLNSNDELYVDKQYPKSILEHWADEEVEINWPQRFGDRLDAAFHGQDHHAYFFKDNTFISSKDKVVKDIARHWGRVKHDLGRSDNIDAAYTEQGALYLFVNDLVHKYLDGIEHQGIRMAEGYPKTINEHFPHLPAEFSQGVDAAFKGEDGKYHLFKGEYSVAFTATDTSIALNRVTQSWGKQVQGVQGADGISAALTALDGATYVFSGDHYYRYSKGDYTKPDDSYPRLIREDWQGLKSIDAAFVLDGKTYLFGKKEGSNEAVYLRYSTSDYTKIDQVDEDDESYIKPLGNIYDVVEVDEFPRQQDDLFWSLPDSLIEQGFSQVDAVLNTLAGKTLLFSGDRYVEFDQHQMSRWWSEPKTLLETWPEMAFTKIDAAFAGKDGKTYLFSGGKYLCFRDPELCHLQDTVPGNVTDLWKNAKNNIAAGAAVDAAFVVTSREMDEDASVDAPKVTTRHTYLFAGDQFYRYQGSNYSQVEAGYPLPLSKLSQEPRFEHLKPGMELGIDAVFSDERNVYLFKGKQCHIVSEEEHQHYNKAEFEGIDASVTEMGRVFTRRGNNWQSLSAIEGEFIASQASMPELLEQVPNSLHASISATLQDNDGNSYFFAGNQCYNHQLQVKYDIEKEWGRSRNTIAEQGHINTGFVGRDGITYVFADDLCYSYTNLNDITSGNVKLDKPPESIAELWGPLRNVVSAFVWKEKTYLFEQADVSGRARYLVFSSDDYRHETPKLEHSQYPNLWKMGQAQYQLGFNHYDCMFVHGDNAIFIKDQQFIRYNIPDENWSYPKDLSLLFSGLAFNKTTFKGISNAFKGPNDEVYFYSHACYVKWTDTGVTDIYQVNKHWGLLDNPLANGVDATLVHQGITYLFFGKHYVRYSSADYRRVDDGYPKLTHVDLVKEMPFKAMGADFQYALDKLPLAGSGVHIRGVHTNARNTYVFIDNQLFVGANSLTHELLTQEIGFIDNNFTYEGVVDAAVCFNDPNNSSVKTWLFSGDQYVRYSQGHYDYIDAGYPKGISEFTVAENANNQDMPQDFHLGIDAAFVHNKQICFYKNGITWNANTGVKDRQWGQVKNRLKEAFAVGDKSIDGAYTDDLGHLYVFKHDQYTRYSDSQSLFSDDEDALRYMDDGYPMALTEHPAHVPYELYQPASSQTIGELSGVFRFENRIFFSKGDKYISYHSGSDVCMAVREPMLFSSRFAKASDYLLRDIYLLSQFKQLNNQFSGANTSLTELLSRNVQGDEPYWALSEIFGFEKQDIRWFKEKNAFLSASTNDVERRFNIELIVRLHDVLSTLQGINVRASNFYQDVWRPLYDASWTPVFDKTLDEMKQPLPNTASEREKLTHSKQLALQELAASNLEYYARHHASDEVGKRLFGQSCDQNFVTLKDQLARELNTLKRDALVPYAIANMVNIGDVRELYEELLIDVQMENEANTSTLKEATMALQLFFHRYFLSLEQAELNGKTSDNEEDLIASLKDKWQWMQNYRVWEANRKVFLYPENYIRPELRDSKTPPFETLEQDLNQGEINDDNMQKVFKKYLDEYTEVSRLKIAGGYLYDEDAKDDAVAVNKKLVLFGRTKSDPLRYYYRFGNFLGGQTQNDSWEPWLPVNIPIEGERVYPVFAFNRVFVFWAKVDIVPPDSNQATFHETKDGDTTTFENEGNNASYNVSIYFSYYNLNKEWIQPQKLKTVFEKDQWGGAIVDELQSKYGISNARLSAELSSELNGLPHENIRVTCQYQEENQDKRIVRKVFGLTPELYSALETKIVPDPISSETAKSTFLHLFDEGPIEEQNTVSLNTSADSTDAPWLCYDHKGGGFLCKPRSQALTDANAPKTLLGNSDSLPANKVIDAAFSLEDKSYYFSGNKYITSDDLTDLKDSNAQWNKAGLDTYFESADAAFFFEDKLYLLDDNECLRYENYTSASPVVSSNFPIANNFKAVLEAMGFSGNTVEIDTATAKVINPADYSVAAAYNKDDDIYLSLSSTSEKVNVIVSPTGNITQGFFNWPWRNLGPNGFDAAEWGAGLTLKKNGETLVFGFHDTLVYHRDSLLNNHLESLGRVVTAAFSGVETDTNVYIFSGNEYITLPKTNITIDYLVTAINNWSEPKPIKSFWLKQKAQSSFDTSKINAAYVDGSLVYLLNANQVQCFKITGNEIADIPELGYPRSLAPELQNNRVDAAFQLTGSSGNKATYIFNSGLFYRYASGQSPYLSVQAKDIKGNVSNIPKAYRTGVTAALNREENGKDVLYLFKQGLNRAEDQYIRYSSDTAMPYLTQDTDYEIVRLTSSTAKTLNQKLFSEGVEGLLQLKTQANTAETPTFSRGASEATNIQVNQGIKVLPESSHLDFSSANGMYYWEIFFHAPYLIAQRLNSEQKFEQAKSWYQHIYDPSLGNKYWKFLLFKGADSQALAQAVEDAIAGSGQLNDLFDGQMGAFKNQLALLSREYMSATAKADEIEQRIDRVLIEMTSNSTLKTLFTAIKQKLTDNQDHPFIVASLDELANAESQAANLSNSRNDFLVVVNHLRYKKLSALVDAANSKAQVKTQQAEVLMEPKPHWELWSLFLELLLKQQGKDVNTHLLQTMKDCFEGFKASINGAQQAAFKDLCTYITEKYEGKSPSVDLNGDDLVKLELAVDELTHDKAEQFMNLFQLVKWIYKPDQLMKSAEKFQHLLPEPQKVAFKLIYSDKITNFNLFKDNQEEINKHFTAARTILDHLNPLVAGNYASGKEISVDISPVLTSLAALESHLDSADLQQTSEQQLDKYLHDPFDPHAIAGLRPLAYKKAIVMGYIDNLLDWGDLLFRQYSRESINEARMLYVLAYDLLGKKPENLGKLTLSDDQSYDSLKHYTNANEQDYDFLFDLENQQAPSLRYDSLDADGTVHDSITNPYFHIPENRVFSDYWTRVEDRLHKIRHSLNMDGKKQPLPLFQPPIDPMALVNAVAAGGSIGEALGLLYTQVPHYRFSYMLDKAKAYTDKLSQFGADLLGAIEKKEAEELEMLHNQQEATILGLNSQIKEDQIKDAEANIHNLEESLKSANAQAKQYEQWREEGFNSHEQTQIDLNIASTALMGVGGLLKIGAGIAYALPEGHIGPFIVGATSGGRNFGEFLEKTSDALETTGDALSTGGEIAAIFGQHERSRDDWGLQKEMAESEAKQIEQQLLSAKLQRAIAQREQQIHDQEVKNNRSIATFMKNKFSNEKLHQWMTGQLSGLYYQSYKMAHDIAMQAQKAFQFETATSEKEVNYVGGSYWDSRRKGLMSGERLGHDLAVMEKAYMEQDTRALEITKNISLLEHDPLAYMALKTKGQCTLRLSEEMFNHDFPGHFNRQVKTISLAFDIGEGKFINATLTQLNNRVLMAPDIKGVKHLLDAKGVPPMSIRSDWRANQQVALSHVDQYTENNGLFELRYDDERYLPFEGTGAVSLWRLQINGKAGSFNPNELLDVTIKLRYTAEQGGEAFASAVRGAMKPYKATAFLDLAYNFPQAWQNFMAGDEKSLTVTVPRSLFPNISGGQLDGIYTRYEFEGQQGASLMLNDEHKLANDRYMDLSNLNIARDGSQWTFTVQGDKKQLKNVEMILLYTAKM